MNWFRVPAFVACRLHGDHVATEYEAWTDLLGRWHMGEDVSACAFAEATKWGKGRVLKFMPKVAEWAIEAGADLPKRWRADRSAVQDRTAHASSATEDEPTETDSAGPESDRAPIHDRTASRARSSSERDQNRTDQMENNNMGGTPPEREITNPEKWAGLFQPTPPEAATTTKPPPVKDRLDLAIRTVYEAYRLTHPRKSPTVSPGDRKLIRTILGECGGTTAAQLDEATENAALLIEWVAQAQDERARQMRGEAPWPGGDLTKRDDLDSLSRHVEPRLLMALAWRDRGRRDEPPPLRRAAPPRPNAPTPFVSIAEMRKALQSAPTPKPRAGVVIDIEEAN